MKLLIDLQACQGPSLTRGIGYYAMALTRALAASRGEHQVQVLLDSAQPAEDVLRLRERLAPLLGRDDVVLFPAPALELRAAAPEQAEAAREAAIAALEPDVVLITSAFELASGAPMSIGRWCGDVPTAAVLYDLIPLADLDLHKPNLVLRRTYLHAVEQLERADLLLSISDYSAAEAQRLLAACPRLVTVHGAAPLPPSPRRPHRGPEGGFGLSVGLHEPRKDISTAVLAWASLPDRVRRGRPFVVAGAWSAEARSDLQRQAAAAGLPDDELLFLAGLDDAELAWLYAAADLFVFPSLVEGLGLPPLEAAQAGTPTLLARSSSLVELFDESAAYFAPGDVRALTQRMTDALTDEAVLDRLLAAAGRAVARFTWTHTAARAWRALEELPAPGGPRRLPAEPVLHRLEGDWDAAERLLVEEPGVVVLPPLDNEDADLSVLLAPVVGVVVESHVDASRALERGVFGAPVVVVDPGGALEAAEQCWATDVPAHWAAARTPNALEPAYGDPFLRRPRWSNRPRGPLLASDVTVYRSTAFLSGIQRATHRLHAALGELLQPVGGAVVPVRFGEGPPGTPHPLIAADPVLAASEVRPDAVDWVLGLDLDDRLVNAQDELLAARADGVGVAVNVYDLLPWAHPEWWPPGSVAGSFLPWMKAVVRVADVLIVNSIATAAEVERFVAQEGVARSDGFTVHLLRLGADLAPPAADPAQETERESDHFLMVGTIEPRKGHREVIDAFEDLWRRGSQARLTVLGRPGWMVEEVVARMDALHDSQPRFSWLRNAPDSDLDRLYGACTAVILASQGEGFGLPVVEAAVRGCPVVMRDIPVLRELAGDAATYFGAQRPLLDVLQQVQRDGAVVPSLEHVHTWRDVGRRLLDILDGGVAPVARWSPSSGWTWS